MISSSDDHELFYSPDTYFNLPKAQLNILVNLSKTTVFKDLDAYSAMFLFKLALDQYLKEFLYPALLAEFSFTLEFTLSGMSIKISGYNHKFAIFLEALAMKIAQFANLTTEASEFVKDNFTVFKLNAVEELENSLKKEPYKQLTRLRQKVFIPNIHPISSVKNSIDALDLTEYRAVHQLILKRVFIEALVSGNLQKSEAKQLLSSFQKPFASAGLFKSLNLNEINENRTIKLRSKHKLIYQEELLNKDDENNMIYISFNLLQNKKPEYVNELMEGYLSEPFFNDLRSEQQIGYIVFAFDSLYDNTPAFNFLIQSGSFAPVEISKRIMKFLGKYRQKIKEFSDEEFTKLKEGLLAKYREDFKSLHEQQKFYWNEISKHQYEFDKKQRAIESIEKLSMEDLKEHFERVFFKDKRICEIHFVSSSKKKENEEGLSQLKKEEKKIPFRVFKSVQRLQRLHMLYPNLYMKTSYYSK